MIKTKMNRKGATGIYMGLIIFIAIHLYLLLFLGMSTPVNTLIELIQNPEQWDDLPFMTYLSTSFAVGGSVLLLLAGYIKTEFPIYAGIGLIFLSFASSYVEFYQQIRAEGLFGSDSNVMLLGAFFIPLILAWVILILEFMRGR